MKITVLRHSIRNRGGDRLVLEYLNYLASRGHDITCWTNVVKTDFTIHPKIQIKKIPIPGTIGTILFGILSKFETDTLIVDLVVMAYFCSWQNCKKLLYLSQGYNLPLYKSKILQTFIKFAYRKVLHEFAIPTVCVSEGLAKTLKIYRPKNIHVITSGISLTDFYTEKESSYRQKRTQKFVIMVFSRNDVAKGFDTAKAALRQLSVLRSEKDWEVWLIGEDSVTIDSPGISVTKLGFLKNDKLRAVFNAADIYLSPSRSEGFGLMQLQAMACGCVMVTTEAFSLVEDEVSGLVSAIDDWQSLAKNLDRVLSDVELYQQLKQNGARLATQYNIEISCAEFENFLKTLSRNNE